VGDSSKEVEEK